MEEFLALVHASSVVLDVLIRAKVFKVQQMELNIHTCNRMVIEDDVRSLYSPLSKGKFFIVNNECYIEETK